MRVSYYDADDGYYDGSGGYYVDEPRALSEGAGPLESSRAERSARVNLDSSPSESVPLQIDEAEMRRIARENPFVASSIEEHRKFVAEYERVHGEGSWNETRDGGEFS